MAAEWDNRPQRQHHFAREILRRGHTLTVCAMRSSRRLLPRLPGLAPWVPPTSYVAPEWRQARFRFKYYLPFSRFRPVRYLDDLRQANFIEAVLDQGDYDVCLLNHPTRRLLRKKNSCLLIYEVLDDLPAMMKLCGAGDYAAEDFARREFLLASAADLIIAVSRPLFEKFAGLFPEKTHLIPNGVEYPRFAQVNGIPAPYLPVPVDPARPLIVYAGALAQWFDRDTLRYCCQALPDCHFVLAGRYSADLSKSLGDLGNLTLLGEVSYAQLPALFHRAQAGLIPFVKHPVTQAASPLKLYEYLAAGLPVVSAPLPDCLNLASPGVVYVADSPEQFAASLDDALHLADNPELQHQRRAIARNHSWERRWRQCEDLIRAHLG